MLKNKKGMTLIELLAVIAIIAILFILLVPQISNAFEKARLTGVKTDLNDYRLAAKSYFIESEGEDKTAEGLNKHLSKNLQFTDGKSKETNAWGKPYELVVSDDKKTITIKTQNKEKEPEEYSLKVSTNDEKEVVFELAGLDGSKKGEASTEEPPIIGETPEEPTLPEDQRNTLCESRTIEETDESFFTVVDVEGGVTITAYSDAGPKDIVIPCQIGGKDVVDIGADRVMSVFSKKNIESVVLPNTLKKISGNFSFQSNNLVSVTVPDSVTSLSAYVFSYNQIKSITIPDSVTDIDSYAFSSNLLTDVTIPKGITTLKDGVFINNQLISVTIPSNIKRIGQYVFYGNQLTSVEIGENVTDIDKQAFYENKLTSVTIPSSMQYVSEGAFYENKNLKKVINKSSISNNQLALYFNSSPTFTN